MATDQLMPPMHADTIRACGVGCGAHHFLHAHMGARPVVVVEASEPVECRCCGDIVAAGQRVLRFDYSFDSVNDGPVHLHPRHCVRGTTPVEARQIAAMRGAPAPRAAQAIAA